MKLFVITPTLGASPWLDETVASVTTCAPDAVHVFVAPAAAVAGLATRFPRAMVVPEPEGRAGMYVAINAGLAAMGAGDAFTYINDDDVLLPDFSLNLRAATAAAGRPLIVYGGVKLIDGRGRRLGAIPISPDPKLNRALYAQRVEPVFQQGMIVTRAVIDAIGGFAPDLKLRGDTEFLARACLKGIPFVCATRRSVAAFRLRPGQASKDRAAMIAEGARVEAMLAQGPPPPAAELDRARRRFRRANLAIYAERIARHGFVTFDQMLERGGQS
jgi:GT2 family glycosyltransferase